MRTGAQKVPRVAMLVVVGHSIIQTGCQGGLEGAGGAEHELHDMTKADS